MDVNRRAKTGTVVSVCLVLEEYSIMLRSQTPRHNYTRASEEKTTKYDQPKYVARPERESLILRKKKEAECHNSVQQTETKNNVLGEKQKLILVLSCCYFTEKDGSLEIIMKKSSFFVLTCLFPAAMSQSLILYNE